MNKTLKDLETLINSYSYLPKRILTQYAYSCTLECKHLMDKKSIECLAVVDRYLKGEATEEECKVAGDRANATAYTPLRSCAASIASAYTAYTASANAAYTAYTAYTAYNASATNTTYAAINASQALDKPISYYYDKFTTILNNLTALEKSLYLNKT